MEFEVWHYWIIAAFVFLVLEVFIPGFILGSMGIGAILAAISAALGLPMWVDILMATIGFFAGILLLKPILKRFENPNTLKTNAEGMIGKVGKVIETIDAAKGSGTVRVDGDDWKAVTKDYSIVERNSFVEVVALESIVITVRPVVHSQVENKKPVEEKVAEILNENKGIIVTVGNRKEIFHHNDVVCFYSNQKITYLVNSDGKQYVLDESLEKLEERIGTDYFFRANRQYIISPQIVKEFKADENGKLNVVLNSLSNLPLSISVSRLKSHAFRKWIAKAV